jgi:predicted nucleic acid-binding protein
VWLASGRPKRYGRFAALIRGARKGTTLNLGDVIIAAVAMHNEVTLLTDNTKDFPMSELSLYPLPKT